MKTKLHSFIIVLALFAGVNTVAAQGTDFTYQGRLDNAGGPANGIYDITFKLWTASSGGAQVGSTFMATGTPVTNGLFTATIGFGTVFNGSSYWLELAVRTNGVGSYQTLLPRQAVTPTPYAITAENVDGAVPASQLSGTIPSSALSGTYGSGLTLNNAGNNFDGTFTGTFSGSGIGLTGVALLAGGNAFTGNQNIGGLLKTGNGSGAGSHTDLIIGPGGYFVGEEHNIDFDDNTAAVGSLIMGYNGNGYFSVGNLYNGLYRSGTKAFTVFGDGNVNIDPNNLNAGFLNNGNTNSSGITFGSTSGEGIASQRTAGVDQFSLEFYTAFINRMIIMNNGFVGIGTTNPAAQLEVDNADASTDSIGIRGVAGSGNAGELHPGGAFYMAAGEFVGANGVIGVGTTNYSDSYGVIGIVSGGGRAIYGDYADTAGGSGYAVYANSSSANGTGVYAASTGTGSALTIGSGSIHISGASTNNPSTAAFIQYATAANTSSYITTINNSLCNGDPNAILIVTHNYNPVGVLGNLDIHPFSVYYDGSHWTIYHDDQTTSILGKSFNVLVIKN